MLIHLARRSKQSSSWRLMAERRARTDRRRRITRALVSHAAQSKPTATADRRISALPQSLTCISSRSRIATVTQRTFVASFSTPAPSADSSPPPPPKQQEDHLLWDHFWQQEIQHNRLQADPQQERVAKKLQKLQTALRGYDNAPLIAHYETRAELRRKREEEARKRQEERKATTAITPDDGKSVEEEYGQNPTQPTEPEPDPPRMRVPRGLYLHGRVGTGKSLLMDNFFQLVAVPKKSRCHFHAFMAQVHERIHQLKQADLQQHGRNFHVDTNEYRNPIVRVGRQIAGETALLCFDEFQVTDVVDALILSQLFAVLFALGTVVVSTSNRPPHDLYEGGVNRFYFLPFIDLLQKHCITHDMASSTDYRRETTINLPSYFFTLGTTGGEEGNSMTEEKLDALVQEMRGDTPQSTRQLRLGGQRCLSLTNADERGNVVRVSFDELCDRELGATDYRCLAYSFQRVIIEDIPVLSTEQHNLARRFITLIDELYEGRCALVCVARHEDATDPSLLFSKARTTNVKEDGDEEMLGIDQATSQGGHPVGALASVRELDFAFERAASRITEMTSLGWWERVLKK